jgi:hypothetical protein
MNEWLFCFLLFVDLLLVCVCVFLTYQGYEQQVVISQQQQMYAKDCQLNSRLP